MRYVAAAMALAAALGTSVLTGPAAVAAPKGDGVFRPYSGANGLAQEFQSLAEQYPGLAKLESIGKSVQGKDIYVLKVTRDARTTPDGARPGTLFLGAQHAREWITPEMIRRLTRQLLTGYGRDPKITSLVDTTELWLLPVANPDGYDRTFSGEPGARFWRKNLRDNNGDGKIAAGDGVDLNRNFGYRWGWDNEGSSPDPGSDLYRGPGPDSEPETKALSAFEQRVRPEFAVNYHSAAQVLLYGVGWQTATPTPDDVLFKSLAGDPAHPAVPGVRPQVTSDISTSNGDSMGNASNVYGVKMVADEMASCQSAAQSDPADEWTLADCPSSFEFPDSEKLIQAEFVKNLPFALSVAQSAPDPADPVSSVDMPAAALTAKAFPVSYADGDPQTVAVNARKSLTGKQLHYRIDQGAERTTGINPWKGGQVYGGHDNLYYDEYRGQIQGAKPGAKVEFWFSGGANGSTLTSAHTTYTVADPAGGDVLVLADGGQAAPYVGALAAAGHPKAAVWDVSTQGTPDALGVLSHFKAVVWAVGTHTADAPTTLAVRDYMNEGGKLIQSGVTAATNAPLNATQVNLDDFGQYWLGADAPTRLAGATGFTGAGALNQATVGFPAPLAAGSGFASISDSLAPAQFPQFRSESAGAYAGIRGPFEPFTGNGFAAAKHVDNAYNRLTRTADLTAVRADQAPQLKFALSFDTEPGFDDVIVEAHTVGADDWTTLPLQGGITGNAVPDFCPSLLDLHPQLKHYLTVSGDTCLPQGTSGTWNKANGSSDGWRQTAVDLSAFAGKNVELSITYVSDQSTGGRGVFVDDTSLVVGGSTVDTAGFETGLAPWQSTTWTQSGTVLRISAAISTARSIVIGFPLESASAAQRTTVLTRAFDHLF
jgi:Zinc carboxypeptidase/Immune inhibitor A-like, MAM domain